MGLLIFNRVDASGTVGTEPWVANDEPNATATLLKDIEPGSFGGMIGSPGGFRSLNGLVYFNAGDRLWRTDGTTAGTVLVKDIAPGSTGGNGDMVVLDDTLYFRANDGTHGTELWKSDGTEAGTVLVSDINPATATSGIGSNPTNLIYFDGVIIFTANNGTSGQELWRHDPDTGVTALVMDIKSGANGSGPSNTPNSSAFGFTVYEGELYFFANDGVVGTELWHLTSGSGTPELFHDTGLSHTYAADMRILDGLLYLGFEGGLAVTDGTDAGTDEVPSSVTEDLESVTFLTVANNLLFFSAFTDAVGFELRVMDVTQSITTIDINPAGNGLGQVGLIDGGGKLFFLGNDGTHGVELWVSDGTIAGTQMVKDINTGGNALINSSRWIVRDGVLYFLATDGSSASANQLWRSDGTNAGTYKITDQLDASTQIGFIDEPAPVANDDEAFVDEFDSVEGNVIAGDAGGGVADSGADPEALFVSAVDGGTVGQPLAGFRGTLTLNTDGSYSYVADNADPLIVGTTVVDSFTYTVSDGTSTDTATLTITITGVATGTGGDEILVANDLGSQLSGLGGNDTLIGGAVADTLIGGAGNDSLDGGAGTDTADYSAAAGAVTVNLSLAGPQFISVSQGSDTLVSIENIVGSGLGDTLTGSDNANRIDAGNGGDTVAGLGGDDLLIGGTGPDSVDGGADNDTIAGGIGNDTLIGGAGNDTADYSGLNGAVTVNLSTTTGQVTGLGTDTISLFENILGGIGNDKFTGTTGANRMEGAGGSDQLNGLGGADNLIGGSGNDNLQGGAGNDTIVGGAGRDIMVGGGDSDTFVFNAASESAVGGQRDRVNDFVQGLDKIDVDAIDAMTGGADDDFAFIGTGAFSGSGTQGELRYFQLAGPGQTIVEGDIDGNGSADFQIAFVGLFSFNAGDFLGVQ